MTALCGGGPSAPLSGISTAIDLSSGPISEFLAGLIDPLAAAILGPIIAGAIDIQVTAYCATDPPSDPGLTLTDVANALNFAVPSINIPAVAKVVQWFKSRYWYQICGCTSTTTPAPPSLSNPGTPNQDPGLPGSGAQPCWDLQTSVSGPFPIVTTGGTEYGIDVGSYLLPTGPVAFVVPATGSTPPMNAFTIPPGATAPIVSGTIGTPLPSGDFSSWGLFQYDASHAFLTNGFCAWASNTATFRQTALTMHAGAVYWAAELVQSVQLAYNYDLEFQFSCTGPPPVGAGARCCPPDAGIQNLLAQILALDTAIYQSLPSPVGSFALGATHSAISGVGNFAISATAIAIQAAVTTIPGSIGLTVNDPTLHFDLGWIGFTTIEGSYSQTRLEFGTQVFSVPLLGYTLNYSLHSGVVVTFTELTRGP